MKNKHQLGNPSVLARWDLGGVTVQEKYFSFDNFTLEFQKVFAFLQNSTEIIQSWQKDC